MPSSALPQVGPAPVVPVILDSATDFQYVVPVTGETSLAVTPQSGFSFGVAGRVVTIRYTGAPLPADTPFTIAITCENGFGSTPHNVQVLVVGGLVIQFDVSFKAAVVNGSNDLRFGVATAAAANPLPISDRLKVGMKLKAVTRVSGSAVTSIDASAFYVVRVDDALGRFRVSATSGGSEIVPDADATYEIVNAVAVNTSPNIFIGNTARLILNQPVTLSLTNGTALPSNFVGAKFVKSIVDSQFITIASTVGGTTLNANADSFPADENVKLVADITGSRYFPAINSDAEISAAEDVAIADYTAASDLDAAAIPPTWAVLGLPNGLSFDSATKKITGTPFNLSAQSRVKLIAYLNGRASYRYLLINSPVAIDVAPDGVFDIATRGFYRPNGQPGRGDYMSGFLNDPPKVWAFEENGTPLTLPASSVIRVWVKTSLNAATSLINATRTLSVERSQFALTEDWTAAALVSALGTKDSIDLVLQLEVRLPSDPAGRYRKGTILYRLRADATQAGTGAPGTPSSVFAQDKPFTLLTGGTSSALGTVDTTNLDVDTWIAEVVRTIDGVRTGERWLVVDWDEVTTAADEATSAARSITIPDNFDASLNPKMWIRIS